MATKTDDEFFVGLQDPIAARKQLLTSVKSMVQSLQAYDAVKEVRKEKIEALENLKNIVKEINGDLLRLKTALPKVKKNASSELNQVLRLNHKIQKADDKIPKVKTNRDIEKKPAEQISKFEKELKMIEQELEQLS